MKRNLLIISTSVSLIGCSVVGPEYSNPSVELPSRFVASGQNSAGYAAENAWWQRLNDKLLNELVARGAAQNLNIQTSLERITAANAALGRVGLNAQTRGDLAASVRRTGTETTTETTRELSTGAAYVFDIFGKFKRGTEQSLANYQAAQKDAGTVRLAYLSDLTTSYIQARYFQEAAAITRHTISSRRRTLSSVQQRLDVGEATELDRKQAQSLLASAEASLPMLQANFEINVFRIATLLAEPAEPIMARMKKGAPQPRPRGSAPVGVPADLLRNRPDILAAERRYAAATAAVGVAEAELYPSVNLNGFVSIGTNERWSFGPTITLPVLNRGLLRSRAIVAQSQAREAELNWRSTVLAAVEDVQIALTLCRNWYRQMIALERAQRASRSVLSLSRETYILGSASLTEVLDAERVHANNRLAVADALRNYAMSWVQVQVSTGQGWGTRAFITNKEVAPPAPVPDVIASNTAQIQALR